MNAIKSSVLFFLMADWAFAGQAKSAHSQISAEDPVAEYFDSQVFDDNGEPIKLAEASEISEPTSKPTTPSGEVNPPSATPTDQPQTTAPMKTVKKKKKKLSTVSAESTSTDAATSSIGHGAQDNGSPYKANVSIDASYNSQSQKVKYSDESFKSSKTKLNFGLSYLFLISKFEIGPKLAYFSSTTKSAASPSTTIKETGMGFGGNLEFDIGNIQQESLIPFIGASVLRNSSTSISTSEGSSITTKTTSSEMHLGLAAGVKFFMGAHVAIKPFFQYELIMSGQRKNEITGSDTVVASVTGNELTAGVGIATYF